jgi:hypothetical protein
MIRWWLLPCMQQTGFDAMCRRLVSGLERDDAIFEAEDGAHGALAACAGKIAAPKPVARGQSWRMSLVSGGSVWVAVEVSVTCHPSANTARLSVGVLIGIATWRQRAVE